MSDARFDQVAAENAGQEVIPVSLNMQIQGGGVFYLIIERERDGQKEREIIEIKNLITDLGLDIFIRNLINSSPVSLSVTSSFQTARRLQTRTKQLCPERTSGRRQRRFQDRLRGKHAGRRLGLKVR